MAKVNPEFDNDIVKETTEPIMPTLATTQTPVVITAVTRKAYIGNFETIDVYCGVALPVAADENIVAALEKAAAAGFAFSSQATFDRYSVIKEAGN